MPDSDLAVPVPLSLGGRELLMHPLTVEDLGIFRKTARERAYDDVPPRILKLEEFGINTPDNRKEIAFAAMASIDSGRAEARFAADMEGTTMLLWLSLRHGDGSLTLEAVRKMTPHASLPYLQERIDRVSIPGGGQLANPTPAGSSPSSPAASSGSGSTVFSAGSTA